MGSKYPAVGSGQGRPGRFQDDLHPRCLFPRSVDHFLGWSSLDARLKQRLL
jgi:hypothetical protein